MPASSAQSSWCCVAPVLTLPELLRIRWKQSLLQLTSAQSLALTKADAVEMSANGAGAQTFEAHQLTVIDKRPVLHPLCH